MYFATSKLAVVGLLAASVTAGPPHRPPKPHIKAPAGFVTVEGDKFKLDGKDFYFAGSNAYYFPFNNVGPPFFFLCHPPDQPLSPENFLFSAQTGNRGTGSEDFGDMKGNKTRRTI